MTSRHDRQMEAAWKKCREFNDQHPIGTPVTYRPLRGSDENILATATRSEAWALPSGEAVVMVERKTGGVSLDHIEVISVQQN
jgi:hypothetical protein